MICPTCILLSAECRSCEDERVRRAAEAFKRAWLEETRATDGGDRLAKALREATPAADRRVS